MASSSSRRTHAVIWSLVIPALMLLYLLSVPILWQKCAVEPRRSPAWLSVYLRPWMWLEEHTFLKPYMGEYSLWIYEQMNHSPLPTPGPGPAAPP